jgi:hypothetical protein
MDTVDSAAWRKSTRSGTTGGNCVQVGGTARVVLARDTKDRDGGALVFTADAWEAFTASLKH